MNKDNIKLEYRNREKSRAAEAPGRAASEPVHADAARRRVIVGKTRLGKTVRVEFRGMCPASPRPTFSAQSLICNMARRYL